MHDAHICATSMYSTALHHLRGWSMHTSTCALIRMTTARQCKLDVQLQGHATWKPRHNDAQ
eukprot:scaffold188115_cov21-Tisochrysis_lutea.AAC.2